MNPNATHETHVRIRDHLKNPEAKSSTKITLARSFHVSRTLLLIGPYLRIIIITKGQRTDTMDDFYLIELSKSLERVDGEFSIVEICLRVF